MPKIADQPFDEPIILVEHDPQWEDRYQAEAARLRELIAGDGRFADVFVDFEHFGSTSVPDLPAKPVIGLMCGITVWEPPDGLIELLQKAGYLYYGQMGRRRRQYLRRRDSQHFNIHIVEHDGDVWVDNLLFRAYLSSHPDEREAYADVKRGALEKSGGQLSDYGSIKSRHMRRLLERAQWWDEVGRNDKAFERRMRDAKLRKYWARSKARIEADRAADARERHVALSLMRIAATLEADPSAEPADEVTPDTPPAVAIASVLGQRASEINVDTLPLFSMTAAIDRLALYGVELLPLPSGAYSMVMAAVDEAQRQRSAIAAEARHTVDRFRMLGEDDRFATLHGIYPAQLRWCQLRDEQIIAMRDQWTVEHDLPELDAHDWWSAYWGDAGEVSPGAWLPRAPASPFRAKNLREEYLAARRPTSPAQQPVPPKRQRSQPYDSTRDDEPIYEDTSVKEPERKPAAFSPFKAIKDAHLRSIKRMLGDS